MTDEGIDDLLWEDAANRWWFLDESGESYGPYETRGQAIDAMIEYYRKLEEE